MAKDDVLTRTLRLNLTNDQHLKVAKVIKNLNPDIYKSQNQFIVDALEFYIDNYGSDEFVTPKDDGKGKYVKREEFELLGELLNRKAIEAAKDEVTKMWGPMVVDIVAALTKVEKQTAEIPQIEIDDDTQNTLNELVGEWD